MKPLDQQDRTIYPAAVGVRVVRNYGAFWVKG